MTLVVGTAGHIDHGKTALLRALTGIDADRLPEERRRGMTLDVGYAHLDLPDGRAIDFVDVPGHDRLIGNMLVGAGEVDAGLLVVAADDGPRPQTIEHLELLDALGIETGVAVVTKADLVARGRVEAVAAEIAALLARTTLARVPVLVVSATTGEGIGELRTALERLVPPAAGTTASPGLPRLPIDRVFSIRGRGVVVTGTLRGGRVERGDTLQVVPGERSVRVREVQVHGGSVASAGPGRVALNLAGIGLGELRRGQVLAAPGAVTTSDRLLVSLRPPAALRGTETAIPADRARLRLHLATDQVDVRVGRAGREAVQLAGGRVTALVRLERPSAVAVGDRFVLRRPSPGATAAAGTVLDTDPPRGVSRRRASAERLAALHAAVRDGTAPEPARLALHGALVRRDGVELADDVASDLRDRVIALVSAAGGTLRLEAGRVAAAAEARRAVTLDRPATARAATAILEALVDEGQLVRDGDLLAIPGRASAGPTAAELAAMDRLVAMLDRPAPPSLSEAARASGGGEETVRALERAGRIVRVDEELAWSAEAWRRLASQSLELARRAPLTPAALRDATGTSRKYVMGLLEDLNRRGILARTEAGHRPGPRADTLRDRDSVA